MIDWTKTVPGPKVLSHIHWVPILCIAGTEKCKQHMRKKREPVSSGTAINSSNINTRLEISLLFSPLRLISKLKIKIVVNISKVISQRKAIISKVANLKFNIFRIG